MIENFILAATPGRMASALIGYVTTALGCAVLLYWNQEFKHHEVHLLLTDSRSEYVCSKLSTISCGLTESYARTRILASGEQKAN
jgi:hypothetical protein